MSTPSATPPVPSLPSAIPSHPWPAQATLPSAGGPDTPLPTCPGLGYASATATTGTAALVPALAQARPRHHRARHEVRCIGPSPYHPGELFFWSSATSASGTPAEASSTVGRVGSSGIGREL
ncbi:hypothetical protein PVAP13_4NG139700 [Panicum virgatum]|uniref:Uncharacterized protein n=1 Tax=Panicum virgatum TaxID=38727 RepID=A0A8T0TCA2_PANVG|nr:hypothetical protein PVAP13_4NG139700 [Panicum virgatum]